MGVVVGEHYQIGHFNKYGRLSVRWFGIIVHRKAARFGVHEGGTIHWWGSDQKKKVGGGGTEGLTEIGPPAALPLVGERKSKNPEGGGRRGARREKKTKVQ